MPSQIVTEKELQEMQSRLTGDKTQFMRWSTEIEPKKDVIDGEFLSRNRYNIIIIDKLLPMGNFKEIKEKHLFYLKRIILNVQIEAGLLDAAEETVTSMLGDVQLSRNDQGFLQKAIITERHELQQEDRSSVEKKANFVSKLIGGRNTQEQTEG